MSGRPWIAFRHGEFARVVVFGGDGHFTGSVDEALVRLAQEIEARIAAEARVKELEANAEKSS